MQAVLDIKRCIRLRTGRDPRSRCWSFDRNAIQPLFWNCNYQKQRPSSPWLQLIATPGKAGIECKTQCRACTMSHHSSNSLPLCLRSSLPRTSGGKSAAAVRDHRYQFCKSRQLHCDPVGLSAHHSAGCRSPERSVPRPSILPQCSSRRRRRFLHFRMCREWQGEWEGSGSRGIARRLSCRQLRF